jgi:hypothetical protein
MEYYTQQLQNMHSSQQPLGRFLKYLILAHKILTNTIE